MSLADTTDENFVNAKYHSDNGKEYTVKLKAYRQFAGGFTIGVGADGRIPTGMKMRYLNLITAVAPIRRETLPVASAASAVFTSGADVTVDGILCKVTGRVGEKATII